MVCETFKVLNYTHQSTKLTISRANILIDEYEAAGYSLTLRQLFYQFVSRKWISNSFREYKKLGEAVNTGRLIGEIDWDAIEDRTRYLREYPKYKNPQEAVLEMQRNYGEDVWADQDNYVEVWIEKDSLVGVIEGPCAQVRVPYYSCRGYSSQSEQYRAAQRVREKLDENKHVVILHLGDHDPSGVDMTRDNEDRLRLFARTDDNDFEFRRIALTRAQIAQYDPPPFAAKHKDVRTPGYVSLHGHDSWELDALDPKVLGQVIKDAVEPLIDRERFDIALEREAMNRAAISAMAANWPFA